MEPTGRLFSQGGILSKDWFSRQAVEQGGRWKVPAQGQRACALTDRVCSEPHFNKVTAPLALPTDLIVLRFYGGKVKNNIQM